MTIKTFSLACLATAAFLPFTGCEGDEEHRHDHDRDHERGWHPTTTTTEETTVHRPVHATTETQTIRTY